MFTAELFNPHKTNWNKIRDNIVSLENEAFGDTAFPAEELEKDFLGENNIIILLRKEETKEIIGFTYALPMEEGGADLHNIVVKKEYRGQGLSVLLLNRMEEELKKLKYEYMELCAVIKNNFAENIAKNYKERIMCHEPISSKWGPQILYRIRL